MSNEKITISVKMVICGNVGVGKTSLFTRINNLEYNQNPQSTSNDYQRKTYQKGNITLNCECWDTAGQEKYFSLNKIFFKDARIAILVYDITRRETYEKLKNFWIKEIQNNGKNLEVIGIAANKIDLYANEQVNENEAREYANSINASFKLCSALNNEGINELVDELIDKYLNLIKINYKINNKDFKISNNEEIKKKKKCC